MKHSTPQKFSVIAFSNRLQRRSQPENKGDLRKDFRNPPAETPNTEFEKCVQEIRNVLVTSKENTEEERTQYNEMLNRAVLGFREEREKMIALINDILVKRRITDVLPANSKYGTLAEAVFAEIIGLNVLELILKDKDGLEEIQVVGRRIYEVRKGKVVPSPYRFRSVKEVERIQQNLVLFNNETINPRKKWAEVSLSDGSRVTLTGFGLTSEPTLTIRFFSSEFYDFDALCREGVETMNDEIRLILDALIRSYFNLVVVGPTNSGKTNLMKAMIARMPDHERIVTIESRFELMLKRDFPEKNIVEYEMDEEDPLHNGRQIFKLALRQSPKRIIHAEIRDEDANIYVRACTRGHEGSITTVHVNELEDVPSAIADMCMLDGRRMDPERLVRRITEYVTQVGIEMGFVDGKRKIVRIGEFQYHRGEIRVNDIVRYDYFQRKWTFSGKFSQKSSLRILRNAPEHYQILLEKRRVDPCSFS